MSSTTFTFPATAEGSTINISGIAPFTLTLSASEINFGKNVVASITYGLSGALVAPVSYTRKFTYCPLSDALVDNTDSRSNFEYVFYNSNEGTATTNISISAVLLPSLK